MRLLRPTEKETPHGRWALGPGPIPTWSWCRYTATRRVPDGAPHHPGVRVDTGARADREQAVLERGHGLRRGRRHHAWLDHEQSRRRIEPVAPDAHRCRGAARHALAVWCAGVPHRLVWRHREGRTRLADQKRAGSEG